MNSIFYIKKKKNGVMLKDSADSCKKMNDQQFEIISDFHHGIIL